jgi:tetratricopeptide (TPR) repeat protein
MSAFRRARPTPALAAIALFIFIAPLLVGQDTGKTIRHHRVQEQDPDASRLAEAEAAIEKRDYPAAEALLEAYLRNHDDNYAAWYDLGFVEHSLGKPDASIAAYRNSVERKPDIFESNLNLGLALAEQGRDEAEPFLRAATRLAPATGTSDGPKRAWMALGRFLETKKPDQAVAAFQQAAALDGRDAQPHLAAGTLLEKLDRLAEAQSQYRQALDATPDSADALVALSNLLMRQKRFPEAESLLNELVRLRPQDAGAHLQLGRMLAIGGKTKEAIGQLEAGLKLDPRDEPARRDLADLYAETSQLSQAEALYRTLIGEKPDEAGLHYGLGRVLLKEKKFSEAEKELEGAIARKPDLGEAYGDLAVAANENHDYALAIKAADERAKYLPETPLSYFLRATAYDHLRELKLAAKYYHEFLDTAGANYPDQQWQATHRLVAIEPKR